MSFRVRMFAVHEDDVVMRYYDALPDANNAVDELTANSDFYNSLGGERYTILVEEVGSHYISAVRIETVTADKKAAAPNIQMVPQAYPNTVPYQVPYPPYQVTCANTSRSSGQ